MTSAHPAFDVRIFYRECRSLAGAGYEVTLVAPNLKDERAEGVAIRSFPRRTSRLGRLTRSMWDMGSRAVREKRTIYHFHDPELIPLGLVLKAVGKKVVYDAHEDLPKQILSKEYIPQRLRPLVARVADQIEHWASAQFAAVVAATPAIAVHLSGTNRNTVVVQNFPALDEFRPTRHARTCKPLLAYAGLVAERRGISAMVKAMGMLPPDLGATLELAGPLESPSDCLQTQSLPGWHRVRMRGMLTRAEVRELYASASAGLMVYQPAPNHYEAGPNKLFEYMAAGLPIVASDFPLWRQTIEAAGCGILVDPVQPPAIAAAIEFLLTHPEEAAKMGQRGREAFEQHYNWDTECKKLLQLYEAVLQESPLN